MSAGAEPGRLHPDDLDRLADLVVDRLAARLDGTREPTGQLVDAAEIARRFGVSAEWVRTHSIELGAVRLGDGPRPRLRFDVTEVAEALGAREARRGSESTTARSTRQRQRPQVPATVAGARLLPIRPADD